VHARKRTHTPAPIKPARYTAAVCTRARMRGIIFHSDAYCVAPCRYITIPVVLMAGRQTLITHACNTHCMNAIPRPVLGSIQCATFTTVNPGSGFASACVRAFSINGCVFCLPHTLGYPHGVGKIVQRVCARARVLISVCTCVSGFFYASQRNTSDGDYKYTGHSVYSIVAWVCGMWVSMYTEYEGRAHQLAPN
jgi:hypothetical protein